MKTNITLSSGRIVAHRDYVHAGKPYATEAYMLDGGYMTDSEWAEYCQLTAPTPKAKEVTA